MASLIEKCDRCNARKGMGPLFINNGHKERAKPLERELNVEFLLNKAFIINSKSYNHYKFVVDSKNDGALCRAVYIYWFLSLSDALSPLLKMSNAGMVYINNKASNADCFVLRCIFIRHHIIFKCVHLINYWNAVLFFDAFHYAPHSFKKGAQLY